MTVHTFKAKVAWEGSTLDGYEAYGRDHRGQAPPATAELVLSADEAFNGDSSKLNPEDLLVMAISSCNLLTFLAVAARSHVEVLSFEDDADAEMPDDVRPVRITRIHLHPRIKVADGTPVERVLALVESAHRHCFISNSLISEVTIEPKISYASRVTMAAAS